MSENEVEVAEYTEVYEAVVGIVAVVIVDCILLQQQQLLVCLG